MALTKHLITYMADCDFCSECLDTDEDDWHSALKAMKREGWKIFKDEDGDWAHKCPCCQEDSAASEFFE